MKTKIFLSAVALILTMPAIADFTFIVKSYEVYLDETRLPRNEGGTIAYKPCTSCDYATTRVAVDARWKIDGRDVTLPEFRRQAEALNGSDQIVTVTQNIESKQVTNVSCVVVRSAE